MTELLAFVGGVIAMGVVWLWTDYLSPNSAYRKGYGDALIEEAMRRHKVPASAKDAWCRANCHPGPACPDGYCKEVNDIFEREDVSRNG